MDISKTDQKTIVSGKVFFVIMVFLILSVWTGIFAIIDTDLILPAFIGLLLTLLSTTVLAKLIKAGINP